MVDVVQCVFFGEEEVLEMRVELVQPFMDYILEALLFSWDVGVDGDEEGSFVNRPAAAGQGECVEVYTSPCGVVVHSAAVKLIDVAVYQTVLEVHQDVVDP